MSKVLVAYFSATGTTKGLAEKIANLGNLDILAIEPRKAYTKADLNWNDPNSRSSLEKDEKARVELADTCANFDLSPYDTILVGFPIWWYQAPKIINSFLENFDLQGKKISLFATSGGSGFGRTADFLKPSAEGAILSEGILNKSSDEAIKNYLENL